MTINTDFIRGIIPPVITPIDENECIDEKKLRDQVEFVIKGGVHGILAFGSNGEFYMVDEDESKRALEIILDQTRERVPVFYGVGAIKTRKAIQLAQMAVDTGVKAISVLQPMFIKPNRKELMLHFETIAESISDTPMLLYNNPGRTGYSLSAACICELAEKKDNIVGVKDTSGDVTLLAEIIRLTRQSDFRVMGGKDTLLYATLAHGGCGGVVTMANLFPELVCDIYNTYLAGDYKTSLEKQFLLNPVRLSMDGATFPVATKDMLNLIGRDMGAPYLPTLSSDGAVLQSMKKAIIDAGLMPETLI